MSEDVKSWRVGPGSYKLHHGGWTDERVEQLKALWADGLSASQIARVLGGGLTRNGALGKVHRLGLPLRLQPSGDVRELAPAVAKVVKPIPPPAKPLEPVVAFQNEDGSHITMLTVGRHNCRWPIGHPDEEGFHVCGHPPFPGAPYCDAHMRIGYQPVPQRRNVSMPRYR